MKQNIYWLVLLIFGIGAHFSDALATDYPVLLGQEQTIANLTSGDRITAKLERDRSYCFRIVSVNLSDAGRFSSEAVGVESGVEQNALPRPRFNGTTSPVVPTGDSHPLPQNTRYCFVPSISDLYAIPVAFSVGTAASTRVLCEETTQVGGYNLIATDFAYLEVSVLTNGEDFVDNEVWYRAFSSRGEEIVAEFGGLNRFDHGIHDFAAADSYATLFLVHTGPPGALSATVSQYRVDSVVPFVFTPLTQTPLRVRRDL